MEWKHSALHKALPTIAEVSVIAATGHCPDQLDDVGLQPENGRRLAVFAFTARLTRT